MLLLGEATHPRFQLALTVVQAQYQSGCVEKSKAGLCGDREIDPSTFITLHRNITIGKFAVVRDSSCSAFQGCIFVSMD